MAMKLRGVDRVTILKTTPDGKLTRRVITVDDDDSDDDGIEYVVRTSTGRTRHGVVREELGPVKKQTKRVKSIDKRLRKSVSRQMKMLDKYMTLHDRSCRKRKNGWVKDLGKNIMKSVRV